MALWVRVPVVSSSWRTLALLSVFSSLSSELILAHRSLYSPLHLWAVLGTLVHLRDDIWCGFWSQATFQDPALLPITPTV